MLALLLVLVTTPIIANQPTQETSTVDVDLIVVNRVRMVSTTYDDWGRPRVKTSEQWWLSFWDIVWSPHIPGIARIPMFYVDRGWWTYSHCKNLTISTRGWCVESRGGVNVYALQLLFVDSPFDWELRNRVVYRHIGRP